MIKNLRELSSLRVADSADFQKVEDQIRRYLKYKDRDTVPLKRETYMARREELKMDDEDEEKTETADAGEKEKADKAEKGDPATGVAETEAKEEEGIERTFYLEEAMRISIDLLRAGRTVVSS